MPKISVFTPMCRDIGMEKYQVEGLVSQTFKDYEWVIVDDLHEQRKGLLAELIKDKFSYCHMPPKEVKPYFATAAAHNLALTYARGEIIYFMCDYVVPLPNCLERHWQIHQKYPQAIISGRGIQIDSTPDILLMNKGVYPARDYRMWLFFETPLFNKKQLEPDLFQADRLGVQNWWAGRNDSCPLEPILACNGFDERFDGRWGGQDAELAQRLLTYGLIYLLDTQSVVMEFKHETGSKPAIRTEEEQQMMQYTIINPRVKRNIYMSGLDRNIREERRKCLNL